MTNRVDGGSGDALGAALSLVRAGMTAVAELPLWQQSEAGLKELATTLDELARQQEGQLLRLLGEVSARGLPGQDGTGSTGAWLRSVVPTMRPGDAGSLGKRAEQLYRSALSPELGPVREAIEAGDLRPYQQKLIVDTVEQLSPPNTPADGPEAIAPEVVQDAQTFLI